MAVSVYFSNVFSWTLWIYRRPDTFFPSLSGNPAIWWIIAVTSPLSFLMNVTCAPLILRKKLDGFRQFGIAPGTFSDRREHRGNLEGISINDFCQRRDHALFSNLGANQRRTRPVNPNDRLLLA